MAQTASATLPTTKARAGISPQEWQLRVDLAAAYRLAAIYGWTDLNNTHFSARVPGPDHHFLLNPFGMLFDEITASSLIKVDQDGNVLGESDYRTNPAGFIIHSAIHMAVPRAQCIVHTHSRFGTAVAMQKQGLLPDLSGVRVHYVGLGVADRPITAAQVKAIEGFWETFARRAGASEVTSVRAGNQVSLPAGVNS